MTKTKTEKLLQRITHEPDFRREVCIGSHYWFFHTYFTRYIKHPCAEMHKQMLYFSGAEFVKKLLVLGFPQCGKSLIHSYSLPLWSLLQGGGGKAIVILVANSKERTIFLDRLEQELMCNTMLKEDFRLKYRKKGNHIFFLNPEGRIYIGDLEQDMSVDAFLGQTPDLIIVDPIQPLKEKDYKEFYRKLQNILDHAGNEHTRKIFVGRGGGKKAPLNRLMRAMRESDERQKISTLYSFARDNEEGMAWNSKFSTEERIAHEIGKLSSKEEFFYEYFLLDTIPDIPFVISEKSEDRTYPRDRSDWVRLSAEGISCIEELFFIPYQGNEEEASVLWGVKIKKDEQEKYIFQGEIWRGDPESFDIKTLLEPIREWLDDIHPSAYIICYGDRGDAFSARHGNCFGFKDGYGSSCASRHDVKHNKALLQRLLESGGICFHPKLATKLREIFSSQGSGSTDHWIQHLAIAHPRSSTSPIIITTTSIKKS